MKNISLNMPLHGTKGKLITFCGLDGCGKSTMIRYVRDRLREKTGEVLLTKQPTPAMRETGIFRTFMDTEDNSFFDYRSLSLMAAADRLQHIRQEIMPALGQGKTVLSDRYFYSCLANLRARGYRSDKWIYEIAGFIPHPDIAFFFDLPVGLAVSRVRSRPEERDRYIDMELQYRLREEYLNICRECGGVLIRTDIDIEKTRGEVWNKIEDIYKES